MIDEDETLLPKLNKGIPVPSWYEYFNIHSQSIVGVHGVSIIYVERPHRDVYTHVTDIVAKCSHYDIHGSV